MRMRNWMAGVMAGSLLLGVAAAEAQPRLDTTTVRQVLDAAVERAQEIEVPMGIAVVDAGGNLVGFLRMEGAMLHVNDTAFSKAYTAASTRRSTHEITLPEQVAAGIAETTGGRFTTLHGGVPLVVEGMVVGGLGIGGGTGEQDRDVAQAAARALEKR